MSQKNFATVLVEDRDGSIFLTINRADALNALNQQVLDDLERAVREYVMPSKAVALVVQGAGEKAFVAGADIAAMQAMSATEAYAFARHGQAVTELIEQLPQITVAKVQGFALGGGCELAMACDIIVAAKRAKFGQPEVSLGLTPGFGGTQRLRRRLGYSLMMDLLCAGRILTGEEAAGLGLVARAVAPEELDAEVGKVLKAIQKGGPWALRLVKQLARQSYEMNLGAGLAAEASAFATCFASGEAKEGLSAFIEKRGASFRNE